MRQRQPQGPYFIVAYSSAGAFGYEVARRLRRDGQDVALLALIDPFGLDRPSPRSFGYRVMQARSRKPHFRIAVRLEGWFRAKLARLRTADGVATPPFDLTVTETEFARRVCDSKRSRADVLGFSALLELNTGEPFALTPAELSSVGPDQYFPAFLARVKQVSPDLDPVIVDRIYSQYFGLQVPAQQRYSLGRYDGEVLLIELDGPSSGLVSAQLQPHAPRLRVSRIKVGRPDKLRPALAGTLSASLRDHFLCMRNDQFVRELAEALEGEINRKV
jgi:Thioesterase domain